MVMIDDARHDPLGNFCWLSVWRSLLRLCLYTKMVLESPICVVTYSAAGSGATWNNWIKLPKSSISMQKGRASCLEDLICSLLKNCHHLLACIILHALAPPSFCVCCSRTSMSYEKLTIHSLSLLMLDASKKSIEGLVLETSRATTKCWWRLLHKQKLVRPKPYWPYWPYCLCRQHCTCMQWFSAPVYSPY